jgi:hypothetical protein
VAESRNNCLPISAAAALTSRSRSRPSVKRAVAGTAVKPTAQRATSYAAEVRYRQTQQVGCFGSGSPGRCYGERLIATARTRKTVPPSIFIPVCAKRAAAAFVFISA